MTPERARYIISRKGVMGSLPMAFRSRCDPSTFQPVPDGITEAEDRSIKALWETMPGHTCYFDALRRISQEAA